MPEQVRLELQPLGRVLSVPRGTPLRDLLWEHGVEFPCGGRRHCGRCRVRVVAGTLPPTADEYAILSEAERQAGWRLACRSRVDADAVLEVEQQNAPILVDHTPFDFDPRPGYGVPWIWKQRWSPSSLIATGRVLAVRTTRNPQGSHGCRHHVRLSTRASPAAACAPDDVRRDVGRLVRGACASGLARRRSTRWS